jgi:hypothetical protein
VAGDGKARVFIPVPFDPAKAWGKRDRWHVAGTINGRKVRGVVEPGGGAHLFALGPAWRRDNGIGPGDAVEVTLAIEGPQREMLAPDFAKALAANPSAARFWDSVAQFYRKGYLRWIDATKKRPDERVRRIAEVVRLLAAGRKQG